MIIRLVLHKVKQLLDKKHKIRYYFYLKNIIEDNEGVKEYMEKILGKEDEK